MSSRFTMTNLLIKINPALKRKRRMKWFDELQHNHKLDVMLARMSLALCAVHHPNILQDIQKRLCLLFLVVEKTARNTRLIYDGRFAVIDQEFLAPLHCFVVNKRHQLKLYTQSIHQLPRLHIAWRENKRNLNSQPLHDLLKLSSQPSDPQTKQELIDYLRIHVKPETKIWVYFAITRGVKHNILWYQTPNNNVTNTCTIMAFTNSEYGLAYSLQHNPCHKASKNMVQEYENYKHLCDTIEKQKHQECDPHQLNRAASVHFTRNGLNLAYDLGLIHQEQEWYALSSLLAKTHSGLYVFLDNQFHLRSITYSDIETSFTVQVSCCEHDCQDLDHVLEPLLQKEEKMRRQKASSVMFSFWQKVWKRRQAWVEQRRKILAPLINLLQQLTLKGLHSPYTSCLADIKKLIQNQRAYMYCSQDTHLHAIKFYLTDFAFKTFRNCRGVSVKASSDGTLTMMSLTGLTIINLHNYFDCKADHVFFKTSFVSEPQPGDIFILHQQKDLKKHYCNFNQDIRRTLHMHCKLRGQEWSTFILNYWIQFSLHLLTAFGHDINGQSTYSSASYLSFQCLWATYARMAGPMCHALEKTKQYYEKLIRSVSKGGLMFSIEDALEQNELLDDSLALSAQSITELDIISSYGYSASKAFLPTGFATGFKNVDSHPTVLERMDLQLRHQSFEFRAVYKTLHDMMQRQDIQIRTVYSNFSPYGLFCLGAYPIDLVVITTTGHLFLYQMDGSWYHGCSKCPPLKSYIGGQTWHQVRQGTNKRNNETQRWMDLINSAALVCAKPLATYHIIQDCCTQGYTQNALNKAFRVTAELAKLIHGYNISKQCGKSTTLTHLRQLFNTNADSSYTFIAYGYIKINLLPQEQAPIITYKTRDNKYTQQTLSHQGQIVLTRDYYQWLQETFGSRLHIESMDWILFYATEPCWNTIFRMLTQLRSTTQDSILVSYLKRMINLGCGFFGARTSLNDKCTYRLVNSLPSNYAFFLHTPDMNYTMDVGNNSYFVLETRSQPKFCHTFKPSNTALPMFLSIIEFGKLRLMQILHFIQQHVYPGHFKLLYSNVDNLIFALANANSLEEAIRPDAWLSFHQSKDLFLASAQVKEPGLAKLEWIRNGHCQWKFITLRTQHYCVVISQQQEDANLHKTSGWSGLSSWEAYTTSKQILDGHKCSLTQTRRINKMANLKTHQVDFLY